MTDADAVLATGTAPAVIARNFHREVAELGTAGYSTAGVELAGQA